MLLKNKMWLLCYKRKDISFYTFCIKDPYESGYRFNDLNRTTLIDEKFFDVAEIYLRKGEQNKKETKRLLNYLHSFDDKVEWKLFEIKERKVKRPKLKVRGIEKNF